MKVLKVLSVLVFTTVTMLCFTSCKKDKAASNPFTKDQIAGKWDAMMMIGAVNQPIQLELKNNGVSTLDVQPYDGKAEFTGTWELAGSNVVVHLAYSGNLDYIKFDGPLSSASAASGELIVGGQIGTFAMSK